MTKRLPPVWDALASTTAYLGSILKDAAYDMPDPWRKACTERYERNLALLREAEWEEVES